MIGIHDGRMVVHGSTFVMPCDQCGKVADRLLCSVKTFLTLLYIPLIPLETKPALICTACHAKLALPKDLFEKLRPIAERNTRQSANQSSRHDEPDLSPIHQREVMNELRAFLKSAADLRGQSVLCPSCHEVAHTEQGGLWIDMNCIKCGKEMPAHLIAKIAMIKGKPRK
jgi:hypothetical protein